MLYNHKHIRRDKGVREKSDFIDYTYSNPRTCLRLVKKQASRFHCSETGWSENVHTHLDTSKCRNVPGSGHIQQEASVLFLLPRRVLQQRCDIIISSHIKLLLSFSFPLNPPDYCSFDSLGAKAFLAEGNEITVPLSSHWSHFFVGNKQAETGVLGILAMSGWISFAWFFSPRGLCLTLVVLGGKV